MPDDLRLEPSTRTGQRDDALQARLHDPLWLLGRQLQFGAFWGADGGSPVGAELRAETVPLTRLSPGEPAVAAAVPWSPGPVPLAAVVEREAVDAPAARSAGDRADAGLHFLR